MQGSPWHYEYIPRQKETSNSSEIWDETDCLWDFDRDCSYKCEKCKGYPPCKYFRNKHDPDERERRYNEWLHKAEEHRLAEERNEAAAYLYDSSLESNNTPQKPKKKKKKPKEKKRKPKPQDSPETMHNYVTEYNRQKREKDAQNTKNKKVPEEKKPNRPEGY